MSLRFASGNFARQRNADDSHNIWLASNWQSTCSARFFCHVCVCICVTLASRYCVIKLMRFHHSSGSRELHATLMRASLFSSSYSCCQLDALRRRRFLQQTKTNTVHAERKDLSERERAPKLLQSSLGDIDFSIREMSSFELERSELKSARPALLCFLSCVRAHATTL
jgi:hypothetical protein